MLESNYEIHYYYNSVSEIDGLRRALEEEQVRKTAEERAAGKSSEAGEDALSSHDNPQPATSPTTAGDCHPPCSIRQTT